jgi:hypothetical protein
MNITIRSTTAALAAALLAAPGGALADEGEGKDQALAHAMKDAKVPLERGVSAAAVHEGVPISAKYEMDEGKLQLSVYTMKGDQFSEVIVDNGTGSVTKAEPITSGEDLAAAKQQKEAMGKAKRTLQDATASATKQNPGYRAVSATPRLDGGRPVATVMLLKGDDWKTVTVKLDGAK